MALQSDIILSESTLAVMQSGLLIGPNEKISVFRVTGLKF